MKFKSRYSIYVHTNKYDFWIPKLLCGIPCTHIRTLSVHNMVVYTCTMSKMTKLSILNVHDMLCEKYAIMCIHISVSFTDVPNPNLLRTVGVCENVNEKSYQKKPLSKYTCMYGVKKSLTTGLVCMWSDNVRSVFYYFFFYVFILPTSEHTHTHTRTTCDGVSSDVRTTCRKEKNQ